jgi:hypothetical protein
LVSATQEINEIIVKGKKNQEFSKIKKSNHWWVNT